LSIGVVQNGFGLGVVSRYFVSRRRDPFEEDRVFSGCRAFHFVARAGAKPIHHRGHREHGGMATKRHEKAQKADTRIQLTQRREGAKESAAGVIAHRYRFSPPLSLRLSAFA
jgi:hypothetical protein